MPKPKKEPKLRQRYYGITDAAHYLGVSAQFLYNGTAPKAKKPCPVPFKRIGGKILFALEDLEKF